MTQRLRLLLIALTASASLTGCALARKTPPAAIRYFSPELAPAETPAAPPLTPPVRLRLGRVERIDVLGHRIVRRTSDVELALYQTRRWTERPDEYVRRALLDALFQRGPFTQVLAGTGPTLEVELVAFEEVTTPRHVGRVTLRYVLHDRHAVLASGRLEAEAPIAGGAADDFGAVIAAIAAANREVTAQLADLVRARLCTDPTSQ